MIGTLTAPTSASTALARSARRGSSMELRRPMYPKYRKSRINSDVMRASHAQYVPHVGLPHSAPLQSAMNVNSVPVGARACAIIADRRVLRVNDRADQN